MELRAADRQNVIAKHEKSDPSHDSAHFIIAAVDVHLRRPPLSLGVRFPKE